jgi:pSer/pThr/pTyr-binding forkhead associated (FHA) protein
MQEVAFDTSEVVVGRDASCDLTIEDDSLSRTHVAIRRTAAGFEVHDLGSRNGTWLNARRIDGPARLRDGDRLRLGTREIVFLLEEPGLPEPARSRRQSATARFVACAVCGNPTAIGTGECPTCRTASAGT